MGHSTNTMSMRYSHLAPGQGAELIRALENPSAVVNAAKTVARFRNRNQQQ
jgi:hypothetical protein